MEKNGNGKKYIKSKSYKKILELWLSNIAAINHMGLLTFQLLKIK